jgi:hypothetical protein
LESVAPHSSSGVVEGVATEPWWRAGKGSQSYQLRWCGIYSTWLLDADGSVRIKGFQRSGIFIMTD